MSSSGSRLGFQTLAFEGSNLHDLYFHGVVSLRVFAGVVEHNDSYEASKYVRK